MKPEPNIIDCIQGDALWFEVRAGNLTSSRIRSAIAKPKRESTGELQCRKDLKVDLAVERITKKPVPHFVSKYMEEGKEKEPLARAAYELRQNVVTSQIGFAYHPTIEYCGASPDGLVGRDGLVEFKCPAMGTHGEYLLGEVVPEEYKPQMLLQMAVMGRSWCDFVSYHPDFPEGLDLFVVRFHAEDKAIAQIEADAVAFLAEVAEVERRLRLGLEGKLRQSLVMAAAKERAGLGITDHDIESVVRTAHTV